MEQIEVDKKIEKLVEIFAEARQIIKEVAPFVSKLQCYGETLDFENKLVVEIDFGSTNVRVQNVLARNRITTMGELYRLHQYNFMKMRGAGQTLAVAIKNKFSELYNVEW